MTHLAINLSSFNAVTRLFQGLHKTARSGVLINIRFYFPIQRTVKQLNSELINYLQNEYERSQCSEEQDSGLYPELKNHFKIILSLTKWYQTGYSRAVGSSMCSTNFDLINELTVFVIHLRLFRQITV
jgi:hypothetical protein